MTARAFVLTALKLTGRAAAGVMSRVGAKPVSPMPVAQKPSTGQTFWTAAAEFSELNPATGKRVMFGAKKDLLRFDEDGNIVAF